VDLVRRDPGSNIETMVFSVPNIGYSERRIKMNWKRLFAMLAVFALVGCSSATGPKFPDPGDDETNPLPGDPGNPNTGSLILDAPVYWV
jgi:hypothetical protein